ncbi:FtsX-like permease family protein [Capnocytophaga sp. Marseille-Q4570]|uniref:Cell division protein FtsX n=1 Tax=Capnocytophaga bilenii TaxID=2819369 RepID=A0ABS3PZK1_9FLAO|nr:MULTISPECIES: permease-like cell division protein FtsX [Capnocytophaga]MBO1884773.1 FtsX-like permease family protein [Capnocytophaga bilenii]
MSGSIESFNKRRLLTSYFSVIVSITLVLFLLAFFMFLVLSTKKLANHFKEQVTVTILIKDKAKDVDITQLQKTLSVAPFVKSIKFISKEEAAETFSKDIGEDFVTFIGTNPLQNAIDLSLKAEYADPDKMQEIKRDLEQHTFVSEVVYDQSLVALIHENVNRIGFITLVFSVLFTFVSVLLINASIRLSIYSKRFIIKTMQLVGATRSFIRRPFIYTNVKLGIFSAFVAITFFSLALFSIIKSYPDFAVLLDATVLTVVFIGVFVMGILISWGSTFFATQRFLNLNTNELYY